MRVRWRTVCLTAKPSDRQSVAAHYRIGMRPYTLLRPQRLATLGMVLATTILITILNCATALSTPQQYVVCKKPSSEMCITWLIKIEDAMEVAKNMYSNLEFFHQCGLSNMVPLPPHLKFVTVTPINKNRQIIFCKTAHLVIMKNVQDTISMAKSIKAGHRVRRQSGNSLRGRYRGQTQSQYLAIDRGNGKDDGKAEAHSAADSSRASVSGSSGMGQAQSQTVYDPSCDDCLGRSEVEAESLKRRPFGTGQGSAPGGTSLGGGTLPGSNGAFGPLGTTQGGNGIYRPNQSGGNTAFGPGQVGGPDGNGAFGPSQQRLPSNNGLIGLGQNGPPGGSEGYGPNLSMPGGTDKTGFGPNQIITPSGSGTYGPKFAGTPSGTGVFGPNQHGLPVGSNGGTYGPNNNGLSGGPGSYGPSQGNLPSGTGIYGPNQGGPLTGNGIFTPGQGSSPGGSGTYGPNQHSLPGGAGTGTFGPNPGSLPGTSGVYGPTQGGTPTTSTFGPSQYVLPGGTGTGGYGPNQSGHPGATDGFITTPGSSPTGTGSYGPNQHNYPGANGSGSLRPNQVGTPGGVDTFGPNQSSLAGGGGPGGFGPHQTSLPGVSGVFDQNHHGNAPNGVGGTGTLGPNQNGLPGAAGLGNGILAPIPGGTLSGTGSYTPGTSGNWPRTTGTFQGPDGTTYYCCVAGPNNNPQYFKMGNGGFGTPGSQASGPYGPGNGQTPNAPYGTGSSGAPNNLIAPNVPYGTGATGGNYAPTPGLYGTGTGGQSGLQLPNGQHGSYVPDGVSYIGPYGTGTIGGPSESGPKSQFGPGTSAGQNNLQGPNGQYGQGVTGGDKNPLGPGQYGPGITSGSNGLQGPGAPYIPGVTGIQNGFQRPNGQYIPGTVGGQNGLQAPHGQYGSGSPGAPNVLHGSGQYGPGATGGPNGLGPSGQFVPGIGSQNGLQGPNGQYGPGSVGGQHGVRGPNDQYGPGTTGGQNGLQGPNSIYSPGVTTGQNGLLGPNGQYGTGTTGGQNDLVGPNGHYAPGAIGGPNSLTGPNGQYSPGGTGTQNNLLGPHGQYSPGTTTGQNGLLAPNGQYSPGSTGGGIDLVGPNGNYSPGTTGGGQNGVQGPNGQYGLGTTGGQPGSGTQSGPYGTGSGGPYGPYGMGTAEGQNGPYGSGGIGQNPGAGSSRPYDSGQGTVGGQNVAPGGQYGTGYPQQYGNGIHGTGQNGNEVYGYENQKNNGQNIDYTGAPQNVIDPNSIGGAIDGDDSEAEASVSQAANGTVATASSKGGNEKGRAQTHVHGAYTGGGSFSAQAEISGENKGANSEVTGDNKGASSNAQGNGRNNKSQANVQLGSETGSVLTGSQSEGVMHSSNSQVQGSVKGGMADAQARGPGSTSSQAQIGFTPYKEGDKSHELQKTPFVGGGTAAAQSSGRTGSSQSQLRGTFKYGITYNGAAQAGASLNKDTVFPNRLPFDKINVYDESNKNINVNTEANTEKTSDLIPENIPVPENPPVEESPNIPENPSEVIPSTDVPPFETKLSTETVDATINNSETEYGSHTHSDHHKTDSQLSTPTRSPPVESRRSFQPTYSTNGGDYEYTTDKDDSPPEDYDVDDGFGPEGGDNTEVEQGEYTNYNEFARDPEATHQSLHTPKRKGLEVRQATGGNTQHIVLDSLADQDAEITQRHSERPDESRVYQPGEHVPGTGGYTIPVGFTGSVKSVASKDNTYVVGSKDSTSQAQTVSLTPGSGKVKYTYPSTHARNVNPKDLRSLYHPKSDDNNRYVSVSKSVTRDLDTENNIRKQYSHTYYTKSSSCGFFTFTCTMVSGAEGPKKVCKPKMPTNPDGTPMRC